MKNRYTILLLIVGVGIMLAMLYFIGLEDVLSALAMSNLYLVLLAILVQIFTYYLYTFRWYLINEAAGINKGVRELLPMVMVSLAVNNLTPSGRGGGEPVQSHGYFSFPSSGYCHNYWNHIQLQTRYCLDCNFYPRCCSNHRSCSYNNIHVCE